MFNKLEKLKVLLQERKEDVFTIFALAKELEKIGDIQSAQQYFYQIIDLNPDYIGVYYHLGKLLEYDSQENKALEIYKMGIDIAKKNNDFHALSELQNAFQNLQLEMDI
ncbi:MAG: hypothetical protein LC105_01095 [Chitinophagales bacterium]|nr:hypothetical protein [Chitinophagales bacterium]MCZ2392442.1 hypothetical protein [Chitinophagales bacterium]